MPVYFVTGKLGSGKTLSMVGRMRHYLERGSGVVTNVNIDVRKLCGKRPALMPIRLPDKPTVDDLLALGACHRTGREELNGCIVLDECGTWLNSRGWSDKGRGKLIDWLLHSRKLGWDVFFIIQNASMMDKQIREALCEYHVTCRRLDRLRIPFIGKFLKALTFGLVSGNLPKVHMATVHYGLGPSAFLADTWYYRGHDLYDAYQTVQIVQEHVDDQAAISNADAFPSLVQPGAAIEGVQAPADAGMHSLVWYETRAEVAACAPAQRALRPKLPIVQAVERCLPPAERVRHLARLESLGLLRAS